MRELLFPFREPVDSWTARQKFDSTVAEWDERQWLTQSKYSPQRLWHPQSSPHHLLPLRQPLRTNKRFRLYFSRQYRRIKWFSDWEQLSLQKDVCLQNFVASLYKVHNWLVGLSPQRETCFFIQLGEAVSKRWVQDKGIWHLYRY